MKFLHIADLHLGRTLMERSLIEDQRFLLHQILNQIRQHQPDALLICGDVYDKPVPSQEAVGLFNEFLTEIRRLGHCEVMMIAGNHDAPQRLQFASEILSESHIHIAGLLPNKLGEGLKRITLQDDFGEVDFILLPYLKPSMVRTLFEEDVKTTQDAVNKMLQQEIFHKGRRKVLLTHQFYTWDKTEPMVSDSEVLSVGGLDNVDVRLVEDFDYVAMGHIHGPQKLKKETIRYSGSLMKYSLSEIHHQKSMPLITLKEKGTIDIELLPLTALHDVCQLKGTLQEVLHQTEIAPDDYISVLLKDPSELLQAHQQLQEVYENLLEVRLDDLAITHFLEEREEKLALASPKEAFSQFYQQSFNETMSEEEWTLFEMILNEARIQEVEE